MKDDLAIKLFLKEVCAMPKVLLTRTLKIVDFSLGDHRSNQVLLTKLRLKLLANRM